jgi:hypothetical protein
LSRRGDDAAEVVNGLIEREQRRLVAAVEVRAEV